MWRYEKRLQFPVNIKKRDLRMARVILTQYGGPDGELAAALRYLNQRYSMPDDYGRAMLTDIGTEELAHVEMVATMVRQLMEGASIEEIKAAGLDPHYAVRGMDLFPSDPFGNPFTAAYIGAVGDPLADISENMAAEQKARAVYENLINLATDQDVIQPLLWLREREVVHFNMFKQLWERYKNINLKK
ncbi:MAG TPA: manganese catalase family protein [Acholeplasmataceae bacterium]|nr:manganese catalase family protein [Acholeplasmataceae bacterium]